MVRSAPASSSPSPWSSNTGTPSVDPSLPTESQDPARLPVLRDYLEQELTPGFEALGFIDRVPRLLRPRNYPDGTPGRGTGLFTTTQGKKVLVLNVMGRLFMDPLDDDAEEGVKSLRDRCEEFFTSLGSAPREEPAG